MKEAVGFGKGGGYGAAGTDAKWGAGVEVLMSLLRMIHVDDSIAAISIR